MLRALSSGEEDQFDNSHSIEYWAKKANLLPTGPEEKQDNFRARLFDLNLRWRANQRYYNMKMLDTWLHNINLDGRVRGDRVKVSTERMLELANEIVGLGVNRWNKKS